MRFAVHVRPGVKVPTIGGIYAGSLVVRVQEAAVDGAANAAVLQALARELHVGRRDVRLVHGRTSRRKLIDVIGDDERIAERLDELRGR